MNAKILILYVYGYFVLAMLGFVSLSLFVQYYFEALVDSQNFLSSVQEWRGVANGVKSGWHFVPNIDAICIVAPDGKILESQSDCTVLSFPKKSPILGFLTGEFLSIKRRAFEIDVRLEFSIWWWALLFPFSVTLVFGISLFFFRRTFTLKNQLEIVELFEKYDSAKSELTAFQQMVQAQTEQIITLKRQGVLAQIASQVSHDIRSPLTALNMVVSSLKEIPEEHRTIIKAATNRISDIANQLLQQSRSAGVKDTGRPPERPGRDLPKTASAKTLVTEHQDRPSLNSPAPTHTPPPTPALTVEFLPAWVESLVSEKRIQFREILNISIECELEESYGAFVSIDPVELSRALSNLINNAIEAQSGQLRGQVLVSVKSYSNVVLLTVRDRGPGIPDHVLKYLGEEIITFGKGGTQSGSGLGVYHAKKAIDAVGGKFEINSQSGLGTEIRMAFKPALPPSWYVENITLTTGQRVVILDDDSGIHSVWRKRFSQFDSGVILTHFTSGSEFCDWIETNRRTGEANPIALVDYELLGQPKTGLELIEQLGIAKFCVLVTSRFDDEAIQKRCIILGLHLLPKSMANFVPIQRLSL